MRRMEVLPGEVSGMGPKSAERSSAALAVSVCGAMPTGINAASWLLSSERVVTGVAGSSGFCAVQQTPLMPVVMSGRYDAVAVAWLEERPAGSSTPVLL